MPDQSGYWGTTKPPTGTPLDRSHPLARGLISYWPLGDGSTLAPDIFGPYTLISSGISANMVTGVGAHGGLAQQLRGSPEQLYSYPLTDAVANRTQASIAGWVRRDTTSNYMPIGWFPNSVNTFMFIWYTDGNLYGVCDNGGSGGNVSTPLADLGWHHIVLSYDGARGSTDRIRLYVDGTARALTAAGTAAATSISSVAALQNFSIGYSFLHNVYGVGGVEDVAVWDRGLTADEVTTLYAQPYAMFAPPVWRRVFVPATVITTTQRRTSSPLGARVGSRQAI